MAAAGQSLTHSVAEEALAGLLLLDVEGHHAPRAGLFAEVAADALFLVDTASGSTTMAPRTGVDGTAWDGRTSSSVPEQRCRARDARARSRRSCRHSRYVMRPDAGRPCLELNSGGRARGRRTRRFGSQMRMPLGGLKHDVGTRAPARRRAWSWCRSRPQRT